MISRYRTIQGGLRHEIDKVKGSRFITSLAAAANTEAVQDFLEARRKEFFDATHNCWAWRLGTASPQTGPEHFRCSDDGEPSGTAGRPILQEIDSRELTHVVVVVTRYFGGTKLGKGGLVRAYSEAAAAALDLAEVVEVPIVTPMVLHYAYPLTSPIFAVLAAYRLDPSDAVYGEQVELRLAVPIDQAELLRRDLIEATGNAVRFGSPTP